MHRERKKDGNNSIDTKSKNNFNEISKKNRFWAGHSLSNWCRLKIDCFDSLQLVFFSIDFAFVLPFVSIATQHTHVAHSFTLYLLDVCVYLCVATARCRSTKRFEWNIARFGYFFFPAHIHSKSINAHTRTTATIFWPDFERHRRPKISILKIQINLIDWKLVHNCLYESIVYRNTRK